MAVLSIPDSSLWVFTGAAPELWLPPMERGGRPSPPTTVSRDTSADQPGHGTRYGYKEAKAQFVQRKKILSPFFYGTPGTVYEKKGGDTEKGSSVHFLRGGTFLPHPEFSSLTKK
jgi:hypothetical protein